MDTKSKNKIEASVTGICVIASILGMIFICSATFNFLNEHYGQALQLLLKLF